jgi:hypothetical protein
MDPTQTQADVLQIVNDSENAEKSEADKRAIEQEYNAVCSLLKEYEEAREFDKDARAQYAVDRRYAAGTADLTWAVTTNLIGSHIDILTSFLYARDPDVSCKKAPQVDNAGTKEMDQFARTMMLTVSRLWRKAKLKRACKKQVRSGLSVGPGWLKVNMIADAPNNPQMRDEQNDIRDNIARLEKEKIEILRQEREGSIEEYDAALQQYQENSDAIQQKMEASLRKYLAIDFVSAEDVQISLDVRSLNDHLEADWNADAIYRTVDKAKEMFPRLTDEDFKTAKRYYQRKDDVTKYTPLTDRVNMPVGGSIGGVSPDEAEQFTANNAASNGKAPEFVKIIELWDRRTNHIKTMIDGMKRWAKEPYQPNYGTSRFFPYFLLEFYETDGTRHSQSLPGRLRKLQDEYSKSRSNFRLTRERSIPGIIVDGNRVPPDQVEKLTRSVHQEIIVLNLPETDEPISKAFAEKPVGNYDPRIFDNAPIIADMEKISGVQEALQTSTSIQKTATQADIEQKGFASRTTADRDSLETMLTELAWYTGELAIQALNHNDAVRICGPRAFWPTGMALDDLLTMVELDIVAGSTGKPKEMGDRAAWGTVLPVIKETIMQIQQAIAMGNIPLAHALSELVKETMIRMGDDTDVERFIPQIPDPEQVVPGAVPGMPGMPGALGTAPAAGGGPALPPAGPAGGAAPPLQNPELKAPDLAPPAP